MHTRRPCLGVGRVLSNEILLNPGVNLDSLKSGPYWSYLISLKVSLVVHLKSARSLAASWCFFGKELTKEGKLQV